MAAEIRLQLQTMRAALVLNPAADTAAALADRLYRLQRLDIEDELGEYTATMDLLGSLSSRLRDSEPMSAALRATTEQAYTAELNDFMRYERYTQAETLLDLAESRVESENAEFTSALTRIALDEVHGEYASAVTRIGNFVRSLGEDRSQLVHDLQTRAALLNRRMAREQGEGVRTAEEQTYMVRSAESEDLPHVFALNAAYPNPFNPQTRLTFSVADFANVEIVVFDVLGREIRTLMNEDLESGNYETVFDGSNLSSGMYLVRMTARPENGAGIRAFTQRITLLK